MKEQQSQYKLPLSQPSGSEADNLLRWATLTDEADARITANAESWRNGLAGFVTILAPVLIFKGGDIGELASPWKWLVIIFIAASAILLVTGLWAALSAQSPPLAKASYKDTVTRFGSIAVAEREGNQDRVRKLGHARRCVALALIALLGGMILWWTVPTATKTPVFNVTWTQDGVSRSACGELAASLPGKLSIKTINAEVPRDISYQMINEIKLVSTC